MKKNNLIIASMMFFVMAGAIIGCTKEIFPAPTPDDNAQVAPSVLKAAATSIGNGVNLQPSYYNNGNVNFGWELMKQYPSIKSVRMEIEPDKVNQACEWIRQARSHGFQVIATYHHYPVLGSDNTSALNAAADWWVNHYATLSASGTFTINLMNEWGSHSISSGAYAAAYNQAIAKVRQVYSGLIIIDLPGWGQGTHVAANASSSISDGNIAFSAHIYPGAYNGVMGRTLNTSDLDYLDNSGRPCLVGEFGSIGSGSADWAGMVEHAKAKGWPVLGWAWNGCGEGMNMVEPAWSSNPSATSFWAGSYMSVIIDKIKTASSGGSLSAPCGLAPNGFPYCCNASSDPDGDGWGWENGQSCVVNPNASTGTSTGCGTAPNGYPYCCDASSDLDGDGWGWENGQSCVVR